MSGDRGAEERPDDNDPRVLLPPAPEKYMTPPERGRAEDHGWRECVDVARAIAEGLLMDAPNYDAETRLVRVDDLLRIVQELNVAAKDELTVSYFPLAAALGRALEHDSQEFWEVIVELNKVFPQFSWHNAMTDSAASRDDEAGKSGDVGPDTSPSASTAD